MALGQTDILDNTSLESHLGGDIDGVILPSTDSDITMVVGGGRTPAGAYINTKEWIQFKGFAVTAKAKDIAGGARKGYISLTGVNEKIHGKMLSVDDDGRCSFAGIGMNMWFPVKDAITLDYSHIGDPVIGDGGGHVKPATLGASTDGSPTDAELLLIFNARGFITDYSNTTGDKWVKVDLWA